MQNAKDSFYEVLRDRISALNPERTIAVRGVMRPGVLVDENETQSVALLADCFHLRWQAVVVDGENALPMVRLSCEISYATAGSKLNSGLDRGRCLAAMDAELLLAATKYPKNAPKSDYTALVNGGAATPSGTRIWWSDPSFAEARVDKDRVVRKATIDVMSWQEAGEL